MALPPQTRALLSLDFTAVEEINYQHIFEQMLDDCGLTPMGHPVRPNWELNEKITEKMKKWLGVTIFDGSLTSVRLRQACSHPGVGNWRAGNKEMRTMDEVLDKMYEDTCAAISRDERELFIARLKRGQIYDYRKDHETALAIWEKVLGDVSERVQHKVEEVQELKGEVDSDTETTSSEVDSLAGASRDDELRVKRIKYLRTRRGNELRDLQDLQHRATFMMASANYQLKNEKEEIRLYDEAEKLRREVSRFCFFLASNVRSCATQFGKLIILSIV